MDELHHFGRTCLEDISDVFFAGQLPHAVVLWDLDTPPSDGVLLLGKCETRRGRRPVIRVPCWLLENFGPSIARRVLLHEALHLYVAVVLGGPPPLPWRAGPHDNPLWQDECDRIALLLGGCVDDYSTFPLGLPFGADGW